MSFRSLQLPTGGPMGRHQTGYIFESKSGTFHVRYYATEIVNGQLPLLKQFLQVISTLSVRPAQSPTTTRREEVKVESSWPSTWMQPA